MRGRRLTVAECVCLPARRLVALADFDGADVACDVSVILRFLDVRAECSHIGMRLLN